MKNGSYHDTLDQLKSQQIEVIEYSGIKPNPVVSDVDEAAELGRREKVDLVVAVGGGSVIDSAKIIAVCISEKVKGWDVMTMKHEPLSSIPLICVLTLAATGTEMNPTAVLQNHQTDEKIGFRHPVMFNRHSFLDPNYTISVPGNYTAYGIVDLVAHSLEAWFGEGEADLSDRFVVAIIKEAMEIGPKLMKDLENYTYRERIMWAATNALNDVTLHGRVSGDWGVHQLGHVLSYLYDTPHGATLSIVYPSWLRHLGSKNPARILKLGKALFGTNSVEETAMGLEKYFSALGSPVKASKANIGIDKKDEILNLMNRHNVSGMHIKLNADDRAAIVNSMM
jgi:alcohol dehydrogenase YqhD (iron-dependent ADH family)